MVCSRAVLATARQMVVTSTGTCSCGRSAASLATWSALSLPARSQWDGTHWAIICRWPSSERLESARQAATPSGAVWAAGPSCRVASDAIFSARVVTRRRRSDHVSDAIRLLGWLTARQLIDFHTLCAVQRVIKYEETAYLYDTIGPRAAEIHEHNTRRASDWTLPRIRTEAGHRRLCYRGCSLLNEHRLDPADNNFCALSKAAMKADDT